MMLKCGKFELKLDRPLVMGIVNLTPDSFSGDGTGSSRDRAIAHAHAQLDAGADILDLGAESSRPGALPTSLDEELDRLLPVLEALQGCPVPISVDTYKPAVMRSALAAGASMINDIFALRMPGAVEAIADSNCAVCLMHMQGQPLTMQKAPEYGDVLAEVCSFLTERVADLASKGVARERLLLDPGFGFGKTLDHNLQLLAGLNQLAIDGLPLLAGLSRKSMLGQITGRSVDNREFASVAAAMLALSHGAKVLRVHDVAATRDAVAVWEAYRAVQ